MFALIDIYCSDWVNGTFYGIYDLEEEDRYKATTVSAHGYVQYITANGVKSLGYDPGFRYQSPAPLVAGWFADNPDIGFVPPINYTSPDIICHKSSTPGQKYVTVTAGSTIQLQWNPAPWPESHVGPIIDYLAPCPSGSCTNVAKADLKFVKLAQQALKAGVTSSTDWLKAWVVDDFIKGGSVWNVTIPKDIKKGVKDLKPSNPKVVKGKQYIRAVFMCYIYIQKCDYD
ncbi:putative endoglucanase-7 [Glarea lozoyensis 74030]|uniref:Putative endoglucanase-7 n=1 Tax=Glarea lozoyensis (strain ATCC 74030 / MF5533) TaxID=1104152 RepID=H0EYM3_GLAL7|nr:putative endoglucanase-7 [Glarea lozoyensis 74030]